MRFKKLGLSRLRLETMLHDSGAQLKPVITGQIPLLNIYRKQTRLSITSNLSDLFSKYHNCIKEYTKSVGKTQTKTHGEMRWMKSVPIPHTWKYECVVGLSGGPCSLQRGLS